MLLESIQEYFNSHSDKGFNACFIIGGFANLGDEYTKQCIEKAKNFPSCSFFMNLNTPFSFNEVKIINSFSDFGVVPSLFEPGGLV